MLDLWRIGSVHKIKSLVGDESIICRLNELGFLEDREFEILHLTPFRGPIVVDIQGTTVALRVEELACIQA